MRIEGLLLLALAGCAAPGGGAGLAALLPAPEAVGAARAGQAAQFARGELWINLNGAAAIYEDSGCQRLITRDYTVEGVALTIKVFELERPLEAFGLFSQLRGPENRPLDLGDGGALGSSDLIFWQGKYFASVLLRDPGQQAPQLLERVGRAVSGRLPAGTGLPAMLRLLPGEGRVAHSEQYIRQNGAGYASLHNGVAAQYRLGAEVVRLQVFRLESREAAVAALEELAGALEDRRETDLGEGGVEGRDAFEGETAIFTEGAHLVLLQGEADGQTQRFLLERCAAGLGE